MMLFEVSLLLAVANLALTSAAEPCKTTLAAGPFGEDVVINSAGAKISVGNDMSTMEIVFDFQPSYTFGGALTSNTSGVYFGTANTDGDFVDECKNTMYIGELKCTGGTAEWRMTLTNGYRSSNPPEPTGNECLQKCDVFCSNSASYTGSNIVVRSNDNNPGTTVGDGFDNFKLNQKMTFRLVTHKGWALWMGDSHYSKTAVYSSASTNCNLKIGNPSSRGALVGEASNVRIYRRTENCTGSSIFDADTQCDTAFTSGGLPMCIMTNGVSKGDSSCFQTKTKYWWQAQQICADGGGRLCSISEIEDAVNANSSLCGGSTGESIWTINQCATNNPQFKVINGTLTAPTETCVQESAETNANVWCCGHTATVTSTTTISESVTSSTISTTSVTITSSTSSTTSKTTSITTTSSSETTLTTLTVTSSTITSSTTSSTLSSTTSTSSSATTKTLTTDTRSTASSTITTVTASTITTSSSSSTSIVTGTSDIVSATPVSTETENTAKITATSIAPATSATDRIDGSGGDGGSSSNNTGAIVGAIIAVLLIIAVILALYFFWWRKRETSKSEPAVIPPTIIPMQKVPKVQKLTRMTVAPFDAAVFESLEKNHVGIDSLPIEIQKALKTFNRYKNILPNPETAVTLAQIGEDPTTKFINANYIRDFAGNKKAYIAAQGPKPETIESFWRMIWESNARAIVMVTGLSEGNKQKCARYWPSTLYNKADGSGGTTHGEIEVQVISGERTDDYKLAVLNVVQNGENREVRHYWFDSWPDYGVPKDSLSVPKMLRAVRDFSCKPDQPWVVHCSAGIGRTGTFIGIDIGIYMLEGTGQADVMEIIRMMRSCRGGMVQVEEQAEFVHRCLSEYADLKNAVLDGKENLPQANEVLYENIGGLDDEKPEQSLYANVDC
eukprot:m.335334 g.335334  ORF g.335334 m.335334 type:complete len:902 (-) comp17572_c0_seq1:991-3696(-)